MTIRLKRNWPLLAALVVAGFAAAVAMLPQSATAGHPFLTSEPPMITLTGAGDVLPIINSGEKYHNFTFQGIPDGIGLAPGNRPNTVEVFVNHEETTVPFRGSADFQDASVSRLTLDTNSGAVLKAKVAIPPRVGFLRFCSAFMAGPAEGFSRYTFFTGEETNDIVDVPPGAPYGSDPGTAPQRQGGYAVILDAQNGQYTQVAGMGRLNHENTVVIPGDWNRIAMVTTDDTFTAATSQLYMYLARNERAIWRDQGSLWAFRVTATDSGPVDPTDAFNNANDYLDIQPGDDWQGEFIFVPDDVARGETGEAPQDALENWSNFHNVFQFVRLEDLAYDKNNPRVVYVADTGASRVVPNPTDGRMHRPSGATGQADNGRIFRFVFNEDDPKVVDSFSVFADGDAMGVPEAVGFVNTDNIDTSVNSLMVQEDADNARIWRYDFNTTNWTVIATVNDPDGESSGIVDASEWFGPGSWILDVQAHGSNFAEEEISPELTLKLEDGQLLLMNIPGS
jgi:hypothetical protein